MNWPGQIPREMTLEILSLRQHNDELYEYISRAEQVIRGLVDCNIGLDEAISFANCLKAVARQEESEF